LNEELRALRRALMLLTVGVFLMCAYITMLACDYRIEVELGDSLNPLIGRYAVLLVQYNPPEVKIGDIVTIYASSDIGVAQMRKVLYEVDVFLSKRDDGSVINEEYIHIVSPTRDYGKYPVSAVRAKVVCILFKGFVHPPTEPIIFPDILR